MASASALPLFLTLVYAAAWAAPASTVPAAGALLSAKASAPRVLVAEFSGVISPVAAEYMTAAIREAEKNRYDAVVIRLDTPGGLDLSMREIVKAELSSTVPIIVYVSPPGARATSAGVFITMAAHVAAMAPGTNIGAAHPVQIGVESGKEKTSKVMEDKIANDAAAYLQAIAARRGRNAAWAELVVVKSTSIPSAAAVAADVVDFEAETLEEALKAAEGRVLPDFKDRALRLAGATQTPFLMSRRQKLLAAVSDPNVAMIFMSLGVSGLLIELYSPGLILPGIVGAVSLVLAFYSFSTLSASLAGVILVLLGFLFLILELKLPAYGLLGLAGMASAGFGMMMMFKRGAGGLEIAGSIIFGSLGAMALLLVLLVALARAVLRRKPGIGAENARGETAEAVVALDPRGEVLWRGERWRAESLEGRIEAGGRVVIEAVDGLVLKVRRAP